MASVGKLQTQLSNNDFFSAMDQVRRSSSETSERASSNENIFSTRTPPPVTRAHSTGSLNTRAAAETELRAARLSMEANKDSLLKILEKEDLERRREARKREEEKKKLVDMLEKSGMF